VISVKQFHAEKKREKSIHFHSKIQMLFIKTQLKHATD